MADLEKHLILHRLDDPLRFFYWTIDEAVLGAGIPIVGLMLNYPGFGLIFGLSSFWVLRKLKKRLGGGTLRHALYWYFPHNVKHLKVTPPSYIREYVG
jgi:type IV conjugative transfer system protein TraL